MGWDTTSKQEKMDTGIVNAATELSESFEEMQTVTTELSGTLEELAQGFASLGDAATTRAEPKSRGRTKRRTEPPVANRNRVADD